MTPAELTDELLRLSRLLDEALAYAKGAAMEYAEGEDAYRMARSKALLNAEGTVAEKTARADLETSAERRRAHLAEVMKQVAIEAIRSRRAQLSALQTIANGIRSEIEMSRYGPPET
jgi:hypothetical protein